MRLCYALPALLAGLTLAILPGAARAGSFSVDGCAQENGWGLNAWDWVHVNPLPTEGGWPYIAHNDPDLTLAPTWTTSPGEFGKRRFWKGGANGPFNQANGTTTEEFNFPQPYQYGCSYPPNGLGGMVVRTANVDSVGNHIYGVGGGSFSLRDYNTDGAPIIGFGGRVYTYSAAEYCWHFQADCNARKPIREYNLSDSGWKAIVYKGGVYSNGFYGNGTPRYSGYGEGGAEGNNPSGKTVSSQDPTPIAQTLSPDGVTSLRFQVSCGGASKGGCVNSSHQDRTSPVGSYLRAYSVALPYWGSMPITLQDNYAGAASIVLPDGWVRGTRSVTASGSDGSLGASGVVRVGVKVSSSSGTSTQDGPDTGMRNSNATSCANIRRDCSTSHVFSINTTTLPNGSVSVYGRMHDDAGNGWVESGASSMYVDNTPPTGPNPVGGCAAAAAAVAPAGEADSNNREWLRGDKTVVATGCDGLSGLDNVKLQYQTIAPGNYSLNNLSWGSSWSDMSSLSSANPRGCSSGTDTGGGSLSTLNCTFNTAAFPEGTAIRFRWWGEDLATGEGGSAEANALGNVAASDPSGVRYLDNTAPTLSNMRWEAYDDRADSWEEVTTGWTNAKKTRLRWNAVSAGSGSPIDKYFYLYDPDPEGQLEGTTSGSCAAQQPNGWLSAVGVTLSEPFNENRAEQCRQGKHQAWIWVRDVAGNGAEKPDKSKAAGTSTVKYDSVPTPESREESWSKSETLAPQSLRAYPGDDAASVGKWTRTNLFTLAWTNPAITNVRTQSPILKARYQVGGGSTLGDTLQDVQEYTGCLVAGESCTLAGIKAPSEGSHPVRMWLQDAAGNSSLEQSSVTQINYRDGTCVQP